MIPRNLSRYIILVSSLAFVALASSIPIRTDALATHPLQGSTIATYCSSEMAGNVVYISKIFQVSLPRVGGGVSNCPLGFAFQNYLIEEYDFKRNSPHVGGCRIFTSLSEAEANRRQIISQAQQLNKQTVELPWNPGPMVAVDRGDSFDFGPQGPPPTHTICAIGYQNTTYFSAVFDTSGSRVDSAWENAFHNFLKKNYDAEGLAMYSLSFLLHTQLVCTGVFVLTNEIVKSAGSGLITTASSWSISRSILRLTFLLLIGSRRIVLFRDVDL